MTSAVKSQALETGFARVGIAPAGPVARAEAFQRWLAGGLHADMRYMARNVAQRLRPDLLVPGARSVICLAAGYAPKCQSKDGGSAAQAVQSAIRNPQSAIPLVARFACGRDYHKVLKRRCIRLMDRLRKEFPGFAGRAFVDSGPVMERSLAAAAGVGWIGRNGCLVAPGLGSYVLLCEIICNLPLAPDGPIQSQCEGCGLCVEACPTGALRGDGLVDARLCISYQTIENRGEIPPGLRPLMGRRIFGCDACQEACPHNKGLPPGDAELIADGPVLGGAGPEEILRWTDADWDAATRGRTLRRATCEMFRRNAAIAAASG
ncbi:MAG: tRNA epoxyqueuosine(34) reductase QueG [Phycisphaerae bacterium]